MIPMLFFKIPNLPMIHRCTRDLLEMERKLDWTMMRKRSRTLSFGHQQCAIFGTTRIMRIFMSHTTTPDFNDAPNFETGEGIPAWALKIEGRDKSRPRKFSTFIKRMIVELDRDATLYPDGNIVAWPRVPNPPLDGFTIRRKGDVPTKVRHYPEQFRIIPELGSILGIKEDSRIGIQGLQDKVDRRLVRADEKLRPIFNGESILFQKLPELVNPSPEPIVLHYIIDPTVPSPERPLAWDVEIKTEDLSLKSRMAVMVQATKDSAQSLSKIDDEIAIRAQSLHNSHLKRTFLWSFARDPAQIIQTWLESQFRDLETVLGSGPTDGLAIQHE
ncbi:SWI/SNF complex 60 kDa subunit [Mycena rebaudengoi]|nr:SWI/SNF complex 60 kDa subunit [Mycena rebaudengoi]